jgi:tetratricopeptide (TPR) repeat protein
MKSLLVVPVLLLAAGLARAGGDSTPASSLDPAMAAFKEGDYAKAADAAAKVPAEDPLYPKAQYVLGESRLAQGDAEAAEKAFRAGLEKKPESGPLLTGLGRALTARGSNDEAMKSLQKALKIDAKDAVVHRALGECLAAQGKGPEARKELEQAVKLDPKDPLAARALVEHLVKANELDAAGKAAEACKASDPKGAMGDFLRGLVLDRSNKGKDAIEAYEAALAKDPKFLDAHKNLAILCVTDNPLYSNKQRTQKALEHFARYFELGGKDEELKRTYESIKAFIGGDKGQ